MLPKYVEAEAGDHHQNPIARQPKRPLAQDILLPRKPWRPNLGVVLIVAILDKMPEVGARTRYFPVEYPRKDAT